MDDWHPRDDGPEDSDELDDALAECGFIPTEGTCVLAGTEYCDWDCPFNPTDPTS